MVKKLLLIMIFSLFVVNVVLFSKSVILSDSIQKLETNIHATEIENQELEKKMYLVTSLDNLDRLAPSLGFTKKAEPEYLDLLRFAQAK